MIRAPKILLLACVLASTATFIEPAQRVGLGLDSDATRSVHGYCDKDDPYACNDGNPCTEDTCDPFYGCEHAPRSGGQTACGIGPCRREVTACVNGVPQRCQPGPPSVEVCNDIDDDCDGVIDDGTWLFVLGHRVTCRYR